MRNEKRWLRQVLKAAADKHIKMPWEQSNRPAAFVNLGTYADNLNAKA